MKSRQRSKSFQRIVKLALVSTLIFLCTSKVYSKPGKAEKLRAAKEFVEEALHREIYGTSQERQLLLDRAAKESPDFAPVMWHRGYVYHRREWVRADDYSAFGNDPRLDAYFRVRSKYADTVEGQMQLADWCRRRKLVDQQRAHLTQVLNLAPDHLEARKQLGYLWIDGAWTHVDEIRETILELRKQRSALEKWSPEILRIRNLMTHESSLRRQHGRKQLSEINDAHAIFAMEVVLSTNNQRFALMVLEQLALIPQHEAALSLARHAVASPWPDVRKNAAMKLRERHIDTFVPAMISAMYTPLQTQMDIYRGPGGRLVHRHSIYREGQSERQLLVLETAYKRIVQPGGDRGESLARAFYGVRVNAQQTEMNVANENRRILDLNTRIAEALSIATGELVLPTPESWWSWWKQYNELHVEGDKPIRAIRRQREIKVADRPQNLEDEKEETQKPKPETKQGPEPDDLEVTVKGNWRGERNGQVKWRSVERNGEMGVEFRMPDGTIRQHFGSCFAAGTPVWTSIGPTPIERICVGDLVLSQDIETGELAYKPVLRTTLGPPTKLLILKTARDAIHSTGGHPFWVCGEGWKKARELRSGMLLHCIDGSTTLSTVELGNVERAYNLVVADFQSYFVGQGKLLCHDITVRGPTDAIVPGLLAE